MVPKSAFLLLLALAACAAAAPEPAGAKPAATSPPKQMDLPASVTLQNSKGFKVVLSPIGATIQSIILPDCKTGKPIDVALGYDDVAGYLTDPHPSYGATVGRVANRISDAKFSLGGQEFRLLANEGRHSIHGGAARWSKATWSADKAADGLSVTFTHTSKDGDGGYPGTVTARVTYSIPAAGSDLAISMSATTTKATPLNIINHAYFNLKGSGNGDILDHVVQIPSQYFTPSPPGDLLPTGQIFSVKNTPYDFTGAGKAVGKDLQRANGGPYKGFDLNYVMPDPAGSLEPVWWKPGVNPQVAPGLDTAPLRLGATVTSPASGVRLRVLTNAPGIHFYSGNFMSAEGSAGPIPNKGGIHYPQHTGFCFETQGFPNAINTPTFPSIVVKPGETFNNRVTYAFSC